MEYDWTITAKLLKDLRSNYNGKGISHAALSKALEREYGEKISASSLKNYEVSTPNHTKARKVEGMSIRSLYYLADFFGVSTDYLLGKTKHKTPDIKIREICDYTGLSEKAVAYLHFGNASPDDTVEDELLKEIRRSVINSLLETSEGAMLVNWMEIAIRLFQKLEKEIEDPHRSLVASQGKTYWMVDFAQLERIRKDLSVGKFDADEAFSDYFNSVTGYKRLKDKLDEAWTREYE